MHKASVVAATVCLLSICAVVRAQQFPSSPITVTPSAQPQTIHLDVLVKDQSGMPAPGIPEQFFTVLDNGQPQKLVSFKAVDTGNNPDAVHVLIVMDMINTGYHSVTWGREQLSEYLGQEVGSLHNRTSIAVMTEDGLKTMNGSSIDGNQLQVEFRKIATDLRPVTQAAGWAGLEQLWSQSLGQFNEILALETARPGRKLVLFISPGWPMMGGIGSEEAVKERRSDFGMIVGMTDSIRDARTAIYLIDPFELGDNYTGNHNPFYYQDFLKPMTKPADATYPYLGMGVFAIHSGGRVLVTGKDITGELSDVMRDAGSYYELTYATPPAGGPNLYHAIKVQVNQPGAFVQTISGYYADPQSVGAEPKARKQRW
jgi:VWFA-related protein